MMAFGLLSPRKSPGGPLSLSLGSKDAPARPKTSDGPKAQRKAFFCDVVLENEGEGPTEEIQDLLVSLGEALDATTNLANSSGGISRSNSANDLNQYLPPLPPKSSGTAYPTPAYLQQCTELISTEASYVRRLKALKQHYADPLRNFARHRDTAIISAYDANTLFGNLDTLIPVNQAFLHDLESLGPDGDIGDICLRHMPNFSCYSSYYINRDKASQLERDLMKKRTFSDFIDRTKFTTSGMNNVGLRELLMEPVQRIPRYKLLFEGMIRHLPAADPQRTKLQKAIAVASQIAACETDETTKRAQTMYALQRAIEDFPPNLISHNRAFIDCLDVDDLPSPFAAAASPSSHPEQPIPCTLFLFTDKLMIVRRPNAQSRGRKLAGLDDLEKAAAKATPARARSASRGQLVCKGVVDVWDVVGTDLAEDEIGLLLPTLPPTDEERFSRLSRHLSIPPPTFSASEPLSPDPPKLRFLSNLWRAQALFRPVLAGRCRALVGQGWEPLVSGGLAAGRGKGFARCFWNLWEGRERWFSEPRKGRAVLHIDPVSEADPIEVGVDETDSPHIVFRAQPLAGRLCRLTTTVRNPDDCDQEIVAIEEVIKRMVYHIQGQGLYDYRPAAIGRASGPGTPSSARPKTPTSLFGFDTISRNLFNSRAGGASAAAGAAGSTSGARAGDVFGSSPLKRSQSLASKSTSSMSSAANSASTPPTSLDGSIAGKPYVPVQVATPPQRKPVRRKQSPGWDEVERTEKDAAEVDHLLADESERDLAMRLDLARQNSQQSQQSSPAAFLGVDSTRSRSSRRRSTSAPPRPPPSSEAPSLSPPLSPSASIAVHAPSTTFSRTPTNSTTHSVAHSTAHSTFSNTSTTRSNVSHASTSTTPRRPMGPRECTSPPPSRPVTPTALAHGSPYELVACPPPPSIPPAVFTPTKPLNFTPRQATKRTFEQQQADAPKENVLPRREPSVGVFAAPGSHRASAGSSRRVSGTESPAVLLPRVGSPSKLPAVNGLPLSDRVVREAQAARDDADSSSRAVKRLRTEMQSLRTSLARELSAGKARSATAVGGLPRSPGGRNMARAAEGFSTTLALRDKFEQARDAQRRGELDIAFLETWMTNVGSAMDELESGLEGRLSSRAALVQDVETLAGSLAEKDDALGDARKQLVVTEKERDELKVQVKNKQAEIEVLYESFNEELDAMYNDVGLPQNEALAAMGRDLQEAKLHRNAYLKENRDLKRELRAEQARAQEECARADAEARRREDLERRLLAAGIPLH